MTARATSNRPWRSAAARTAAALLVSSAAATAAADTGPWPAVRNHNPFLQIFGVPAFEPETPAGAGETVYAVDLDIANHADSGSAPGESAVLDGESYRLTLALRHGISDRLVLGADIPFISHSGGFLDAPIENWHDLWGLSNHERLGPRDKLNFSYAGPLADFRLTSPSRGLGDILLSASVPLSGERASGRQFGVRAGLKLPTGDSDELLGSGAVDYSLAFYASDDNAASPIGFAASIGILLPGRADVLERIRRDSIVFGGLGVAWRASANLDVTAVLHAQGAAYESELNEIGGKSVQLSAGGLYRLPWAGMSLSVGIIEDLFDDATTDFAFQLGVRGVLHSPGNSR